MYMRVYIHMYNITVYIYIHKYSVHMYPMWPSVPPKYPASLQVTDQLKSKIDEAVASSKS